MDNTSQKLKELLTVMKEFHKYQLDQNDQFTQRTQLIFVITALYFNVAFVFVNLDFTIIFIFKLILLFLLGSAIFWSLPIIRQTGYKTSPKINSLVSNFMKSDYNYNKLLAYLIKNYQISINHNTAKNSQRHKDFRISMYLIASSTR